MTNEIKVIADKHIEAINTIAKAYKSFYNSEINKTQFLEVAKIAYEKVGDKETLEGMLDWFSGMSEDVKTHLPLASSGSFYYAILDVDSLTEYLDEDYNYPELGKYISSKFIA